MNENCIFYTVLYNVNELTCKVILACILYVSCAPTLDMGWDQKKKQFSSSTNSCIFVRLSCLVKLVINPLGALLSVMIKETHFDVIMVHRQQLGNILSLLRPSISVLCETVISQSCFEWMKTKWISQVCWRLSWNSYLTRVFKVALQRSFSFFLRMQLFNRGQDEEELFPMQQPHLVSVRNRQNESQIHPWRIKSGSTFIFTCYHL